MEGERLNIEITVESAGTASRGVKLGEGEFTVGSHGCAITLAYPTVSRSHGRIVVGYAEVIFFDLSSRNGSTVGGTAAIAGVAMQWASDAVLAIGPFRLSWRPGGSGEARAEPELDSSKELARFAGLYQGWLVEQPARARELLYDSLTANDAREELVERIYREFHGDGPLAPWLADPECREILVNAHDELYIDRGGGLQRAATSFLGPESFEAWAVRTAHAAGRRLDLQNPICEATLANGSRFHAVMAPISARGLSLSIRRFGTAPVSEEEALGSGWVEPEALALLKEAIEGRRNIVISGGTSSGKTSLLNFLCAYIERNSRIITVEDTLELSPPIENLVQLQARAPNADGIGQVSLRSLVQCALRMRPTGSSSASAAAPR